MLGSVPADETIIVADLEAGIGTLTRLEDSAVDFTLIVVEPTPRSIDVAKRALLVATEKHQGQIIIVANKVCGEEDSDRIRAEFDGHDIVVIPADDVIDTADRQGSSPIDVDPSSAAVVAIEEIAAALVPTAH